MTMFPQSVLKVILTHSQTHLVKKMEAKRVKAHPSVFPSLVCPIFPDQPDNTLVRQTILSLPTDSFTNGGPKGSSSAVQELWEMEMTTAARRHHLWSNAVAEGWIVSHCAPWGMKNTLVLYLKLMESVSENKDRNKKTNIKKRRRRQQRLQDWEEEEEEEGVGTALL